MKIGIAITGSFCTFGKVLPELEKLAEKGYDLVPVMSFNAASTDTRFYKAENFRNEIVRITGKEPVTTIADAEPMGTQQKVDLMIVAPCTGNTLAKIACGITDTPVTMAVKAHLRNNRPVLIALSSNDALGANAKNIGLLLSRKNVYFVPFNQDSPDGKPNSLIADLSLLEPSVEAALKNIQIQPVFSR